MYVVQQKKKKKNPNHKERRQKWTSKKSQIWQNRKVTSMFHCKKKDTLSNIARITNLAEVQT